MSWSRQLPLSLEHPPSLAGEDFLVADSNRGAFRWLNCWPDWPSPALVVHGPAACGKTHLAHVFLGRSRGMLVDEDALRLDRAIDVAAGAAACVIDDADQAVAAGLERPLLHLYNALAEGNRNLLLTARTPPARWPIRLADLRSRLNTATCVGIGPPDDELIAGLLVKLFTDRQLAVEDHVILYALPRIERSFAAAHRLAADVDAAALGGKRKVTVPLLRDLLDPGSGDTR